METAEITSMIFVNSLRNIQLLEKLLAPTQAGYGDVVASMERLEEELRVVRQRLGDDVQNLGESIHMVCIQKVCPKFRRDHLAVQAASVDSPEKQRLTIEKILQANVHGSGATPLPRPREARKVGKETTKEASQTSSTETASCAARTAI